MSLPPTPQAERDPDLVDPSPWMPYLRLLMWMHIVLGSLTVIVSVIGIRQLVHRTSAPGTMWLTPDVLLSIITGIGIYTLEVAAAWSCLNLRPRARIAMLVYCWCDLGLTLIEQGMAYLQPVNLFDMEMSAYQLYQLTGMLESFVLPIITLIFLTREPIRRLFIPHVEAFEVIQ